MPSSTTTTTATAEKGATMPTTDYSTTYGEACDHAEANYVATAGMVVGGTYVVRFDDGEVGEVDLRVDATTGRARLV